jgi:hypothetical protein
MVLAWRNFMDWLELADPDDDETSAAEKNGTDL